MTLLPPQAAVVAAAARASGDPPARPCGEALGTDRRPPAIATPIFDVCLPLRLPDLREPSAQENAHEKDLGSPPLSYSALASQIETASIGLGDASGACGIGICCRRRRRR